MSTQIRGNKQIKNITIENEQIVNGTVELNKLKEGTELIKRDGSVPFTGNIDAGNNKLVNVAAGVNATDAVNKAQLDAVEDKVGGTLITREIVSGAKNGENVTFTLAEEPTLATEQIFFNGALLNAGANADYTISGAVITFAVAPQPGDSILANYVVDAIQLNVDVQATINQINDRVGLVEVDVAAAEADIAALESADSVMDVRVTATEADIGSLETRATNLETNVDAVEADIAAEESRAMAAESALDVRVSASEVEILGVKTRMTAAEGDIDDLEAADVAMDSRVSNLEDGLQSETTARTNAVSSLNTRVTDLETADTDVDSRLDVLESDVAGLETDLTAEAATRLANDNTLQSNINAEIANRTSAVSAVQSNLNTEIAARTSADTTLQNNINAEAATRLAADNALDARIDALEADPVSQAYVDQKIADLVNSAPAVLDTLKELSDALGGDENFATTIAADIAAVDDRVDTVVADLAQEAIDRAADVDAEESRAMAAESALDVRIDALEADPVTKTYVDQQISAEATSRSNEDATFLKIDGSRYMDGTLSFNSAGAFETISLDPWTDESVYLKVDDGSFQVSQSSIALSGAGQLSNIKMDINNGFTFEGSDGYFYARPDQMQFTYYGAGFTVNLGTGGNGANIDLAGANPSIIPVIPNPTSVTHKHYVDSADGALSDRIDALESAPPPVSSLDSLSDVTVASPSNGQVLQYNGTEWVNGPAPSTFSGSYNDLSNKPDLSVYALDTDVAAIDTRVEALEDNAFVTREVPTGLVDGSNAVFTLANTPVSGSEQVFVNGMLQESGAGNDYTISGDTITFASAPLSGWKVHVSYATGSYMVAPGGSGGSGGVTYQESAAFTWTGDSSGNPTPYTFTHNNGVAPDRIEVLTQSAGGGWIPAIALHYGSGWWGHSVANSSPTAVTINLYGLYDQTNSATKIRCSWFN